jgi:hypothetical protein
MKKFFKWILRRIKEDFIWMTSERVGQAINDGATYEEVCKIVEEEMAR